MARNSLSRFVILGLINSEPMSGYDMKQFVEETIADFWNESYGSLYPTLKKLVAEDLAESQEVKQSGKPNRKVYSITAKGRQVLNAWLEAPFSLPRVRNEFLLKLFFGGSMSAESNRRHIERYEAMLTEALAGYRESEAYWSEKLGDSLQDKLGLLTLRQGTLVLEARLQWCREAIEMLKND